MFPQSSQARTFPFFFLSPPSTRPSFGSAFLCRRGVVQDNNLLSQQHQQEEWVFQYPVHTLAHPSPALHQEIEEEGGEHGKKKKKRQTASGRTGRDRRYAPSVGTAAREGALGVPEEDQRTRLILFLETTSILSWTGGSRLPASPLLSSPLPPSLPLSLCLSFSHPDRLCSWYHRISSLSRRQAVASRNRRLKIRPVFKMRNKTKQKKTKTPLARKSFAFSEVSHVHSSSVHHWRDGLRHS